MTIPSRTQRDEAELRVQLRHDIVDALPTKSPAYRNLLDDRIEVVPVPSRVKLSIETIRSRTQRDEADRRVQLRHNLVDALSTKSPADQTLLDDQIEDVLVLSQEQLAVGRSQVEHNWTKPPADRALSNGQLAVVPVPNREKLAVESIQSQTHRDEAEHRVELRHGLINALST